MATAPKMSLSNPFLREKPQINQATHPKRMIVISQLKIKKTGAIKPPKDVIAPSGPRTSFK